MLQLPLVAGINCRSSFETLRVAHFFPTTVTTGKQGWNILSILWMKKWRLKDMKPHA